MKNTTTRMLFILAWVLANALGLQAQNLVEVGNQWHIAVFPTFSPNTYSYALRIGEDTTLDNTLYHKVYYSHAPSGGDWIFNGSYLRQDSTQKVFRKAGNTAETLLYDFSLAVNDTFQVDEGCTLVVHDVDSVSLNNGERRKRLKLRPITTFGENEAHWIAGIGSGWGLIEHLGFCYPDFSDGLLCFYHHDDLLFPASPFSCFITSVDESALLNTKIYPNPAHNVLFIENQSSNWERFTLYDLTGRSTSSGTLQNTTTIDLQSIPPGFYTLVLIDKAGHLFSQKLVKN